MKSAALPEAVGNISFYLGKEIKESSMTLLKNSTEFYSVNEVCSCRNIRQLILYVFN